MLLRLPVHINRILYYSQERRDALFRDHWYILLWLKLTSSDIQSIVAYGPASDLEFLRVKLNERLNKQIKKVYVTLV